MSVDETVYEVDDLYYMADKTFQNSCKGNGNVAGLKVVTIYDIVFLLFWFYSFQSASQTSLS